MLFEPKVPIVGLPYYLDVASFGAELEGYLQGTVAGYAAQLRQSGQVVYSSVWQDAKLPKDGTERWTLGVQQHVASVSKLVTAMAISTASPSGTCGTIPVASKPRISSTSPL